MILAILLAIITILILYIFSALFFWGLGVFVIVVFDIAYTWTFWHGLVTAIILSVISSILRNKK